MRCLCFASDETASRICPCHHTIFLYGFQVGRATKTPFHRPYFSTSGVHAPHHAPKDWRDKYKGKFDHGWDRQRELTHAKQLEMGIIPKGTKLTPRPKEIPAWDDQPAERKKVYTRLMENYAAYMDYTDHHVGRLIDSLRASGELDNTLVMYVVGDNGASAEGGWRGHSARSPA